MQTHHVWLLCVRDSCLTKDFCFWNSRLVNEYSIDPVSKEYVMSRMSVEFGRYLIEEGFSIIEVCTICACNNYCMSMSYI